MYAGILPKSNSHTIIVINYYRKKYFHICGLTLVSWVSDKFTPLNGRATSRKTVHQCIQCFKFKRVIANILMDDLPKDGAQLKYYFDFARVDLCGSFVIKIEYVRRLISEKNSFIFLCFAFKAIHLEIVSDSNPESFIAV